MEDKRETFRERTREVVGAVLTVADAGVTLEKGEEYGHKPSVPEDAVREEIEQGRLPDFLLRERGINEYKWSIFKDRVEEVYTEPLDVHDVARRLREKREAEMPRLPQDGSRGQWKVANRTNIQTYEWLLGEYDG